ncbi:UNVERIFIED_CONTAM: hypothetical protein GTU68_019903 [Idotea baltica]|nr:hypothetical protein [Idotea baltica]
MTLVHRHLQLFCKRRIGLISLLHGPTRKAENIFSISQNDPVLKHKKFLHFNSPTLLGLTTPHRKEQLDDLHFEHISNETLESLNERLEELIEQVNAPPESDSSLATGVLTLTLGEHGTYIINKQSPNKQIWLSSPLSGPKRYDFQKDHWVYKYDGVSLHELLGKELSEIFRSSVDLMDCDYAKKNI